MRIPHSHAAKYNREQAIVDTLHYINSPEEIAAEMPVEMTGGDTAIYNESLKNSLEMISETGAMDPAAAEAVLKVMSFDSPEIAGAGIDLSKTYTDEFVDKINTKPAAD